MITIKWDSTTNQELIEEIKKEFPLVKHEDKNTVKGLDILLDPDVIAIFKYIGGAVSSGIIWDIIKKVLTGLKMKNSNSTLLFVIEYKGKIQLLFPFETKELPNTLHDKFEQINSVVESEILKQICEKYPDLPLDKKIEFRKFLFEFDNEKQLWEPLNTELWTNK